jgi:hypothetical protein
MSRCHFWHIPMAAPVMTYDDFQCCCFQWKINEDQSKGGAIPSGTQFFPRPIELEASISLHCFLFDSLYIALQLPYFMVQSLEAQKISSSCFQNSPFYLHFSFQQNQFYGTLPPKNKDNLEFLGRF